MTHSYHVSGITCSSCVEKVNNILSGIPGVKAVAVHLNGRTEITMDRHIPTTELRAGLKDHPKYQLMDEISVPVESVVPADEKKRTWFATYKPVILIFVYTAVIAMISAGSAFGFSFPTALRIFMAGFFITFSFFKMLDLQSFADSYTMYDIVAKRIRVWGYIYPFVELALGLAFVLDFQPFLVNYITLIVMSVSLVGVVNSVLNKRKIKCACLGSVFNLPMSFITIFEDSLMIVMSIIMILIMS